MNRIPTSRFGETPDCLLVRLAPLGRAVKVLVPKALQKEVHTLEHKPGHAVYPGVNKMYTSMRLTFYRTLW